MKTILHIVCFIFAWQSFAQVSDFNNINFKKADSIALAYKNEALTNLPNLAYNLTSNLATDVERFRAIYRWVCNSISNDYNLYLKNKRKRERFKDDSTKLKKWNADFRETLFKKLRKDKRTICTGYAYLVKELADLANLKCEIVHGFGRVSTTDVENLNMPNHSWNAIKLNDKWYLCDPTWASGTPDPETNKFTFNYNDGFFLADPELFAVNHFPIDSKWWLLDEDSPSFKAFLASPVIYGKAYKNLVKHNAPKQMHHVIKKNKSLHFNYELKEGIKAKKVSFLVDNGNFDTKKKPTKVVLKNQSLSLDHQFTKTGFYDVHLYFGKDLISTYTVKVEK